MQMAESNRDQNWYALFTCHQHEKAAARILENKGFEIFLPLYSAPHRWRDRVKEVSLPLFPGYVFLCGGLERWHQIMTTPGVRGIVTFGARPATVPPSDIEGVRRMVETTLSVEPHPFLKTGDWVRVKSGPLSGLEGILIRKKNQSRLVLSLETLGQAVAVEVDSVSLERIPTRAPDISHTFEALTTSGRRNSYQHRSWT